MDTRVEATLHRLDRSWNQRVELAGLARAVSLSTPRLQHLFKRETGNSIRAYLLERRLSTAASLLVSSDLRVKEVCYRVGFTDLADFYRSFKKRFSIGPNAFRVKAAGSTIETTHLTNR